MPNPKPRLLSSAFCTNILGNKLFASNTYSLFAGNDIIKTGNSITSVLACQIESKDPPPKGIAAGDNHHECTKYLKFKILSFRTVEYASSSPGRIIRFQKSNISLHSTTGNDSSIIIEYFTFSPEGLSSLLPA